MPSPTSWLAHSAVRSSTWSGAADETTRRTNMPTNWRIIRAAMSWLATLRTSAASRRPPPVWSQIVRKRCTMRSPSRSGSPGSRSAISAVGSSGMSRAAVNSVSLPPNQWLTIAGSTPARSAITRTVAPS